MDAANIERLADALFDRLKGYVDKRIDGVQELVKAIPAGKDGKDGVDGKDGANGDAGERGEQGEKGIPGEAGQAGANGEKGEAGPQGEQGVQGEKGLDAIAPTVDEILKAADPILTQKILDVTKAAVAEIEIPHGQQGAQGEPGQQGVQGLPGSPGSPGENGLDGNEGPPGRDAAHMEILSTIDPEKSYPARTFATHKGGLWRSFQRTEGMKGWECLVNGIDDAEIEQGSDPRQFMHSLKMSDGRVTKHAVTIDSMMYKGVFRDGSRYMKGDCVSYGGCIWHANEMTEERPRDGAGKAWTLAVKSGRDGKDGLNGRNLDPQVSIKK